MEKDPRRLRTELDNLMSLKKTPKVGRHAARSPIWASAANQKHPHVTITAYCQHNYFQKVG